MFMWVCKSFRILERDNGPCHRDAMMATATMASEWTLVDKQIRGHLPNRKGQHVIKTDQTYL